MTDMVRVALDAMGGDNAPYEIVKGAVIAVKERVELKVFLVGDEAVIKSNLERIKKEGYEISNEQLEIVHAPDVISNEDAPVKAIRRKKESSIVVAMKLVKEEVADAFVSAGSTGAVLVGGQLIIGRIRGIERSPLAPLIPTKKGMALLIDCGANVDSRPSHLLQFAKIGSIYMEHIMGVKNPRVGLVNVGVEEEKGNSLVKEAFPMFKDCKEINFTGSIEARQIPYGDADVIVCDAFVGNVILKLYEGVAKVLLSEIKKGLLSSFVSKIGALLVKGALKKSLQSFDSKKYGGAPMLGLNGLVVKSHGNSEAEEIKNSLLQCIDFKNLKIKEKITEYVAGE